METGFFKLEKSPLPKGEYKKALRKPGDKLIGNGWEEDSMEREWVQIILNAINKKIGKLNEPHFKATHRYELLIYDNSHVSGLNIKDALSLVKEAIDNNFDLKSFERNFHSISVIKGDQLFYNIVGK